MSRIANGPLQGTALAIYFVLLPIVIVTKWGVAATETDGTLIRGLLMVLAIFWVIFLFQLIMNIVSLRRDRVVGRGASAWLAGLFVALLALLVPTTPHHHTGERAPVVVRTSDVTTRDVRTHHTPTPELPRASALGAVPLALMAKRRSDLLRQHQFTDLSTGRPESDDVDATITLLRARNPRIIDAIRSLIENRLDGVVVVPSMFEHLPVTTGTDPVVACWVGDNTDGSLVAFAREGGRLAIPASWSTDVVRDSTVALHEGRVVFVDAITDLLRALATRSVHNTTVVYLGSPQDLDDELAACSVTIVTLTPDVAQRPSSELGRSSDGAHEVRVDLLRADPQVSGLTEAFEPTLRRRCVEMVAYLALHRHEPVTGDRLRTRVLANADVDASLRTLANTATAVRRSLGVDSRGPRLHAVTSSGLYVTHGVTSDVELFTTLVQRARLLDTDQAAPLARQALELVKGEPLASALRGFEWFLAEGHGARLARDGEWAALALHHDAMGRGDYEEAFWALRQGLLIDPFSDVVIDAIARVPRLREFGRDGSRGSKDESVGAAGAVAMSWSFQGLGHQVTQ